MSEELFDVVFFGILQAGKDREIVKKNMAALFKTDTSKLAPYFSGGRKVIKGNINAEMAEKYRTSLENVGLVIKIEPSEKEQSKTAAESSAQPHTAKADIDGITIASVGADVIEHPVEVPAQKIADISEITLAETGADVIEHPVEVVAQKIYDISSITMAETGSDILEHPREITAVKIVELSDISLAEAGADLIEHPKAKEKADIPDISKLSLDNGKL